MEICLTGNGYLPVDCGHSLDAKCRNGLPLQRIGVKGPVEFGDLINITGMEAKQRTEQLLFQIKIKMGRKASEQVEGVMIVEFPDDPLASMQQFLRHCSKYVRFGTLAINLDQIDLRYPNFLKHIIYAPDLALDNVHFQHELRSGH
jgi:hypothetical protein